MLCALTVAIAVEYHEFVAINANADIEYVDLA